MPAILVNDVSPVISYTATAGQTLFSIPFEFFAVQDIVVERAGVTLTYSPTPANNNQYSVIGANLEGGGSITLGSPGATLGDKIVIFRDIAIERLANYPETGPMAVRSLNAEQAKHIGMMQQLERDIGRGVTVPIGESAIDLPSAAERADKVLTFDENGNPETSFSTDILSGLAVSSGGVPAQTVEFVATASQTVFNFPAVAATGFVSVFLNGVRLKATDFAHSGATVTLVTGATLGDTVTLEGFTQSAVPDLTSLPTLAASGGSALVGFLQAGTGAVARTGQSKMRDTVSVKDFGAVGDGITNDTAAIQLAVNSGAKVVRGVQGETYLISQTGTKTLAGTVNFFCLSIPSGVHLDMTGATIKRANSSNAIGIINANAGVSQDIDITISGGTWDGNEANQTTPATGEMPIIMLWDVLRPRVVDIKAKNARDYFGRFLTCVNGHFDNLHGIRSDGDGWSFGVSGTRNLTNCFVDNIYAEDCTNGTYGSLQGNPAIFTVYGCTVGKVTGKNCGGGIKIQAPGYDSTFGQLVFEGGVNGTLNSGVKLQGQSGLQDLLRISVGQITTKRSQGYGTFIVECVDCSIGEISSFEDDLSGTVSALYIDQSVNRLQIGTANVQEAGLFGVDQRGDNVSFGSLIVRNTGQVAVANRYGLSIHANSNGTFIDSLLLVDDQGTKTTDRMINIQSGAKVLQIDRLRCVGDTVVSGTYVANSGGAETAIGKLTIDDTPRYVTAISTVQTGNVGTGEDNLCSVSLPAYWGFKDGQGWKITAWGVTQNNANAKTVRLYFGSGAICTTSMTVNESSFWRVEALVVRSSANVQQYVSHQSKGATTFITDIERGQLTQSEAAAIVVKVTGDATADNDIINYAIIVEPIVT